jgi:hypothetical protein
MTTVRRKRAFALLVLLWAAFPSAAAAWFDETHLAVSKAAGHSKWYHAAGADLAKLKLGEREAHNHFVNNPCGTVVTPEAVMAQIGKYDRIDPAGHLYGAIIAALRNFAAASARGVYAEYHLAYAAHYIGDLSQPLHHTLYNEFNRRHHAAADGVVNDEVLENLDRIRVYPITIASERDLAEEIARIANLSLALGCRLEAENRNLTRKEAYRQLSHSASLLKAVLAYLTR